MSSVAFYGGLKPARLALVGSGGGGPGASQDQPLVLGKRYELRCSSLVYLKAGGGQPLPNDLQVVPEAPLTFTADVNAVGVSAGGADAYVWVREMNAVDEAAESVDVNGVGYAAGGCA